MFLEMWNSYYKTDTEVTQFRPSLNAIPKEAQGFVQPYSDTPVDNEPLGENVYIELLSRANRYAYIFTPYLILDNELRSAICLASKRGVDVRIVTPGIPDKKIVNQATKSYYAHLIRAGVKVYEYKRGFNHSKIVVSDDKIATVGSVNFDFRSFYLSFECGVWMYNTPTVADVLADYNSLLKESIKISLEECKVSPLTRAFRSIIAGFAPLF